MPVDEFLLHQHRPCNWKWLQRSTWRLLLDSFWNICCENYTCTFNCCEIRIKIALFIAAKKWSTVKRPTKLKAAPSILEFPQTVAEWKITDSKDFLQKYWSLLMTKNHIRSNITRKNNNMISMVCSNKTWDEFQLSPQDQWLRHNELIHSKIIYKHNHLQTFTYHRLRWLSIAYRHGKTD